MEQQSSSQNDNIIDVTKRPSVFVRLRNIPAEFRTRSSSSTILDHQQQQVATLYSKLAPANVKRRIDTGATKNLSKSSATTTNEDNNNNSSKESANTTLDKSGCVSILEDGKTIVVSAPSKCNYAHLPPQLHYFEFDGCFSALPPTDALNMMPLLNNNNNLPNQNQKLPPPPITGQELFEKSVLPIIDAVTKLKVPGSLFGYGMTSSGKTKTLFGSEAQHMAAAFNNMMNNESKQEQEQQQQTPPSVSKKQTTRKTTTTNQSKNLLIAPTSVFNASRAFSRDPFNNEANPGLVQLACNRFLEEYPHGICISFFEVYNEKLRCLFSSAEVHPVLTPDGMIFRNLARVVVKSNEELRKKINEGMKLRKQASTHRNDHSSRSHAILQMFPILEMRKVVREDDDDNSNNKNNKIGQTTKKDLHHQDEQYLPMIHERVRLTICDAAGSERLCASSPAQQRESAQINLALSNLGRVIQSLAEIRSEHESEEFSTKNQQQQQQQQQTRQRNVDPECRASALTWALRDELQFRSAVSFLITISPMTVHANETLSSLRFAAMLGNIRSVIKINHHLNGNNNHNNELKIVSEQLAKNLDLQRQATNPLQMFPSSADLLLLSQNASPAVAKSKQFGPFSPGSRKSKNNNNNNASAVLSPLSNSAEKKKPLSTLLAEKRGAAKQNQNQKQDEEQLDESINDYAAAAKSPTTTRLNFVAAAASISPVHHHQKENNLMIITSKESRGTSPFVFEQQQESQQQQQVDETQEKVEEIVRQMQYESVRRFQNEEADVLQQQQQQHEDQEEIISFQEPPAFTVDDADADTLQVIVVSNEETLAPNFEMSPSRSALTTARHTTTSITTDELDLDRVEEEAATAATADHGKEEEENVKITFVPEENQLQTPMKNVKSSVVVNNNTDVAIITSANIDIVGLDNIILDDEEGDDENQRQNDQHHHQQQHQLRLYSATTPILNLSEFDIIVAGPVSVIRQWWKKFKMQQRQKEKDPAKKNNSQNVVVSCIVLSGGSSSCFVLSRSSSLLVDSENGLSPSPEKHQDYSHHASLCSKKSTSWWGRFWSPSSSIGQNSSSSSSSYVAKITRARQTESFYVSDQDELAFALQHGDGFDLVDSSALQLRFYLFDSSLGPIQTSFSKLLLLEQEIKKISPSPSRRRLQQQQQQQQKGTKNHSFYLPPVSAELMKESWKKQQHREQLENEEKEKIKVIETNCNTAARSKNFVVLHSAEKNIIGDELGSATEDDVVENTRRKVRQAFSTTTSASPEKPAQPQKQKSVSATTTNQDKQQQQKSLSHPGTEPSPKRPTNSNEAEEEEFNQTIKEEQQDSRQQSLLGTHQNSFTVVRANSTQNTTNRSSTSASSCATAHVRHQHQRSSSAVVANTSTTPISSNGNNNVNSVAVSSSFVNKVELIIESTSTSINPSAANSKQNSAERQDFNDDDDHHHHDENDNTGQNRNNTNSNSRFEPEPTNPNLQHSFEQQKQSIIIIPAAVFEQNARRSVSSGRRDGGGSCSIERMGSVEKQQQQEQQNLLSAASTFIPPLQIQQHQQNKLPLVFGQTNFTRSFSAASTSSFYSKPRNQWRKEENKNAIIENNNKNNTIKENDDDEYEDVIDEENSPIQRKKSSSSSMMMKVLKLKNSERKSSRSRSANNKNHNAATITTTTNTLSASTSRLSSISNARSSVSLAVSDNGIGVVDENFLFDGYQSNNNNTSKNMKKSPRSSAQLRKSLTPRGTGGSSSGRRTFATPLEMIKKMANAQQQQQKKTGGKDIVSSSNASSVTTFFRKVGARLQSIILPKGNSNEPPKNVSQLKKTTTTKYNNDDKKKSVAAAATKTNDNNSTNAISNEARFVENGKASLKNIVETRQQKPVNNSSNAGQRQQQKDLFSFTAAATQHSSPKPMIRRHLSHLSP